MAEQREVEVKIIEVDREAMVKKILALGAKKIFDDVLEMHSFKPGKHATLRVRKEGKDIFLAFKQKNTANYALDAQEYSVKVDDFAAMVKIIELLGIPSKWLYKRHRTSYLLKGIRFEFDKPLGDYNHVPEYLEIEAASEEQVKEAVAWLNIPEENVLSWTAGDVIRHYSKN